MQITQLIESDYTILQIQGEVDAVSAIELDERIKGILASKTTNMLVDCNKLDYISSAGLGVFMSYIKTIADNNQKMVLFGLNENVFSTFEILGLHHILQLVDTLDSAKALCNKIV